MQSLWYAILGPSKCRGSTASRDVYVSTGRHLGQSFGL